MQHFCAHSPKAISRSSEKFVSSSSLPTRDQKKEAQLTCTGNSETAFERLQYAYVRVFFFLYVCMYVCMYVCISVSVRA